MMQFVTEGLALLLPISLPPFQKILLLIWELEKIIEYTETGYACFIQVKGAVDDFRLAKAKIYAINRSSGK